MPPPALPPERPTAAFVRIKRKTIWPLFSATEIQTASVPVCIPPIASSPHRHAGRHLQGFRNGASQHGNHPHQNRRFRQRRQLGTDYGAMGYSNIPFNPEHVRIDLLSEVGEITVCRNGVGVDIDEEYASKILGEDEIVIRITIDNGNASATCWGCDIPYDYIKLNGNYRK